MGDLISFSQKDLSHGLLPCLSIGRLRKIPYYFLWFHFRMHVEVDEEKCTIILRVISLHLDLPSVQSRWVKINLINLFGWWKFCYSFLRNGHFNDTSDKKSGSNELKFYYFHGFEPNIWYVWILSSKHKYAKLCMYVFYFFKKSFEILQFPLMN